MGKLKKINVLLYILCEQNKNILTDLLKGWAVNKITGTFVARNCNSIRYSLTIYILLVFIL